MFRKTLFSAVLSVLVVLLAASKARSDDHEGIPITAGFKPHRQPCDGGAIDWTEGVLLAHGHGEAEGVDDQSRLLAQRAARVDAIANAVAIAAGIKVDAKGRAGAVRNGRVRLEAVVKGHREVDVQWMPDHDPPQCRCTLRVPLWGVKGVASIFAEQQRRMASAPGVRRVPCVVEEVDVSNSVLVIDARGTGLESCLFPVVQDEAGARLYDVARVSSGRARNQPIVHYVETEMSCEQLRSTSAGGARVRLASFRPQEPSSVVIEPATQPATQPTTQPGEKRPRRRGRRRLVVKALQAAGDQKTKIVLTREDVNKLRRDPEAATLLRNGQVVIVKDSAAAGIESRRDARQADPLLALGPGQ